jgi:hypothetical protein
VLTDHYHIGAGDETSHVMVFLNLLRGMTWLEAYYYSGLAGQLPCGDPLWAPFGSTTSTTPVYPDPGGGSSGGSMAVYPSFPQAIGSRESLDEGTIVERAVSGRPRFRTYYESTQRTFEIVHECDAAYKTQLLDFYQANKFVAFDFPWAGDGVTYRCRFASAIQVQPIEGNLRWRVSAQMVVVT